MKQSHITGDNHVYLKFGSIVCGWRLCMTFIHMIAIFPQHVHHANFSVFTNFCSTSTCSTDSTSDSLTDKYLTSVKYSDTVTDFLEPVCPQRVICHACVTHLYVFSAWHQQFWDMVHFRFGFGTLFNNATAAIYSCALSERAI